MLSTWVPTDRSIFTPTSPITIFENRVSSPPEYGLDFSTVIQKLSHPKTKVVLFEAPQPGVRNDLMIELGNFLESQDMPFATSNAYCVEQAHCERLNRFAKSLDRYAVTERTPTIIVLDSGDDLYHYRKGISPYLYDKLEEEHESNRLGRSLSKNDILALNIYKTCHTLIRTLQSPMFKVIMTYQKGRTMEEYEPNLHKAWREAFPYGSDIII
jgi:hypothetical protein